VEYPEGNSGEATWFQTDQGEKETNIKHSASPEPKLGRLKCWWKSQAQIFLLTVGKERGKATLRLLATLSEDSQGDGNKSRGPLCQGAGNSFA